MVSPETNLHEVRHVDGMSTVAVRQKGVSKCLERSRTQEEEEGIQRSCAATYLLDVTHRLSPARPMICSFVERCGELCTICLPALEVALFISTSRAGKGR